MVTGVVLPCRSGYNRQRGKIAQECGSHYADILECPGHCDNCVAMHHMHLCMQPCVKSKSDIASVLDDREEIAEDVGVAISSLVLPDTYKEFLSVLEDDVEVTPVMLPYDDEGPVLSALATLPPFVGQRGFRSVT